MKKGVFSMYATKGKQPTFFIHECAYPKHKEAELGFFISNVVADDISQNMKYCVRGIARKVVNQSRIADSKIKRGDSYHG